MHGFGAVGATSKRNERDGGGRGIKTVEETVGITPAFVSQ